MTHATTQIGRTTHRQAASIAGLGLLAMAILAPFAQFFVFQSLVVPGDSAATMENLRASESLFRSGIAALMVVILLDVAIAWALHIVFEPVNRSLSLLAGWFRLAYSAAFAASLTGLLDAVQLSSGGGNLLPVEGAHLNALVMSALNSFNNGWDLALAIFALHLVCLGVLVFQSRFFPRFLGVLVLIAGGGYLFDSLGALLFPAFSFTVSEFTFIGEALLIFWLVALGIKGSNVKRLDTSTSEPRREARSAS